MRRPPPAPSHLQHLKPVPPPSLKPQQARTAVKDNEPKILKPLIKLTPQQLVDHHIKPIKPEDLLRPQGPAVDDPTIEDDEAGKKDKKRAIPGRDDRQKKRNIRAEERKKAKVEIIDGKIVEIEEPNKGKTLSPHQAQAKTAHQAASDLSGAGNADQHPRPLRRARHSRRRADVQDERARRAGKPHHQLDHR